MSIQDTKNKEVIKEYYRFLYYLATEKKYEHSSDLNSEEREYCEKLFSHSQTHYRSDEAYLSLMEDILKESIRQKNCAR